MVACLTAVTEDLQWCDTSLVMNEVMRTYNGGMPHSLLGGGRERGVITSHVSLMGHGVGTAFISLWWLQWIH